MIKLNDVTAGYGGIEIIKDIRIAFEEGGITTIIGKNGCGKTTLLKTAANLLKPFRGSITIKGEDISRIPLKEFAKRVAYLPQNRNVPDITIYQLVMHGRYPYLGFSDRAGEKDKQIVKNAIETLSLGEYVHENLRKLSGGERQKAYLAMVLAQDTDVIFLDEPTTYLDIRHRLEILEIVKKLKEMNKTVVMVLHDLNEALTFSDKICLMDRGEVVLYDTPQAVFDSEEIEKIFKVQAEQVFVGDHALRQYVFYSKTA
ncbi:MAG: ABC transporter ATP-binding protein [Clostridia bacterium]|jgi:ABC-type cobalamin/Fe3+-siderophores transport system ATPase subunit|nr:ABC transporter ATP-binding protein [Clostridiaceae bacterium]